MNSFFRLENYTVYEIYPRSDTHYLTQFALLDFDATMDLYLLPGNVIWYYINRFQGLELSTPLNHSISFSLVQVNAVNFKNGIKVLFILSEALKLVLTHSLVGIRDGDTIANAIFNARLRMFWAIYVRVTNASHGTLLNHCMSGTGLYVSLLTGNGIDRRNNRLSP